MLLREQDKHFLLSLLVAMGIILVWKGLWEGIYYLPLPSAEETVPWVFLSIGFAILTFSGLIFREFDPLGNLEKSIRKTIFKVKNNPKNEDFRIKYYDKSKKKHLIVKAKNIKDIERKNLVLKHEGKRKEIFIPLHRIEEIVHRGKTYWRL